jgi:hypothetical protein
MTSEQIEAIATRLVALHRRVMELREIVPAAPFPVIWADAMRPDLRTRLQSVDDAESGLEYAVWLIGETLAHTGGDEAMHAVYGRFEEIAGTRGSSWLDHRWNGVSAPGVLWVA